MLALLRTVIQARLQKQQQVNLSLLEAVYNTLRNITLGCSLGAHTLKQVGFPATKSELLPARLLLWENSKVGAGQRLAALHRLCSCLSIMLQSNARKAELVWFPFFFSVGNGLRVPPGSTATNWFLLVKPQALLWLASRGHDKPLGLLEGCKNNSDMSVATQENCVPSSNTRSANLQSQHKMEY